MDKTKLSKFISFVLRHEPSSIGLTLDAQGYVEIKQLVKAMQSHGKPLTEPLLLEIVAEDDKQRYTISGKKIRAAQGHSFPVDLGLQPKEPPAVLYHGTASQNINSIRNDGLHPRTRHQVHLSSNVETAIAVGTRHGHPVLITIDAQRMFEDGLKFFQADNGVWLVDEVPPNYLSFAAYKPS